MLFMLSILFGTVTETPNAPDHLNAMMQPARGCNNDQDGPEWVRSSFAGMVYRGKIIPIKTKQELQEFLADKANFVARQEQQKTSAVK